MDRIACVHCGHYFPASPRHKSQRFCGRSRCQKARKAEWQRRKMRIEPQYRANQKQSHQEWLWANPDYWKDYRREHPEKAARNRALQLIRNRQRRKSDGLDAVPSAGLIAKMDASKGNDFDTVSQFWLVPVIAKMDALKVFLRPITPGYG